MPYTPPSAQSPVASKSDTPARSRSSSQPKVQPQEHGPFSHSPRPGLPHSSSSYLSKHRRSPSVTKTPTFITGAPSQDAAVKNKNLDPDTERGSSSEKSDQSAARPNESADTSPSISPPSSGDDEVTERRGRTRDVKLAELQAAIRIIEQHRTGSPDPHECEETKKARIALGLPGPRLDLSRTGHDSQPNLSPHLPLSAGARKISHSRSTTDASAFFDFPRNKFDSPAQSTSPSDDEDIEDDELRIKPALIRKKSGELVRPALRASSMKRRPSSMPGTPTYSKAVHFQESGLEHVRHFLQVDRPIAVSAGSSPAEPLDEDHEFPFGSDGSSSESPHYEWEIRLTNFPRDTIERQVLPVRTEKVYLSADTKVLHGSVAVRNLAFHKLVVARFTLDYWKTTSEVTAEYDTDVRKKLVDDDCDRFVFSIKLEDQAKLESKTMFFCVRYHVNGQDYWDNNGNLNYQIDFSKNYKQGEPMRRPIPRSKPSRTLPPRPRSMPSFDDFASMVSPYDFSSFPQPSAVIGDSPIRFKNKPSPNDLLPDAPGRPRSSANQQAFGNRYDFGASLSAAKQAASTGTCSPREDTKPSASNIDKVTPPVVKIQPAPGAGNVVEGSEMNQAAIKETTKPAALTSEKPSLSSSSYHELLDKYCFFGSGKATSQPPKPTSMHLDGTSDDPPSSESAGAKPTGSPNHSPDHSPPLGSPSMSVERKASPKITSPRASRSVSPTNGSAMGSRTGSPAFGYPYHQTMQGGLFDAHTPTAIRG